MKITDYFPPSSPPVLLPEVPMSASAAKPVPSDQASDRSEGDSGKENEEDPCRELGARSKGDAGKGKSGSGGELKANSFSFSTIPTYNPLRITDSMPKSKLLHPIKKAYHISQPIVN
jgi:hypothetical protein